MPELEGVGGGHPEQLARRPGRVRARAAPPAGSRRGTPSPARFRTPGSSRRANSATSSAPRRDPAERDGPALLLDELAGTATTSRVTALRAEAELLVDHRRVPQHEELLPARRGVLVDLARTAARSAARRARTGCRSWPRPGRTAGRRRSGRPAGAAGAGPSPRGSRTRRAPTCASSTTTRDRRRKKSAQRRGREGCSRAACRGSSSRGSRCAGSAAARPAACRRRRRPPGPGGARSSRTCRSWSRASAFVGNRYSAVRFSSGERRLGEGQVVHERLARGGPGGDDHVPPAVQQVERPPLVRVQAVDAQQAQAARSRSGMAGSGPSSGSLGSRTSRWARDSSLPSVRASRSTNPRASTARS